MKNVAVQELTANLDEILSSSQEERIVISRQGRPCAVLVGIEHYDAEDLRLASSDEFWRMIVARRTGGKSLPLAEIEARLINSGRKPARKRVSQKRTRRR